MIFFFKGDFFGKSGMLIVQGGVWLYICGVDIYIYIGDQDICVSREDMSLGTEGCWDP